jgi:Holliday junction resolvasome RuvABC DNA-binding subunit
VIDPSLRICEPGDLVERYIWHVIDSSGGQRLFGFLFQSECELAQLLASAPRVGPLTASRLLHTHGMDVVRMISLQDAQGLSHGCDGLSKKGAAAMIQAVQDRVTKLYAVAATSDKTEINKARDTLHALGFTQVTVQQLEQAPDGSTAQDVVSWYLQRSGGA